ncbi:MAG TPA: DUF3298 domain-containing protein, partial [Salinimicrobium sp.]|nr:DUF3298 domain-containing protein [Salinimicrobium sp.]
VELISTEDDVKIQSVEELAKEFISEKQKSAEKFGETAPWKASVAGKVSFQSEILISVKFNAEVYKGGAHGYRSLTFLNINPENGKLYTQKELFTEGFREHAEELFREQQEIPKDQNINSTGFWFKNDIFGLPENIGFDKENVILVYNAYEISPYSDGEIILEIPKNDVLPYLKLQQK